MTEFKGPTIKLHATRLVAVINHITPLLHHAILCRSMSRASAVCMRPQNLSDVVTMHNYTRIGELYATITKTGELTTVIVGSKEPSSTRTCTLNASLSVSTASREREKTVLTIPGTNDKAIAMDNGALVFQENGSCRYFPLPCTTSELFQSYGGANPSVINVKCGSRVYELFKYREKDDYGVEMITTLPSVESPTAFVKYSGTASVASVKDGFVWFWTDINGSDSPDLQFAPLQDIECEEAEDMTTFTDDEFLMQCSNKYVIVNIDGSHHDPSSLPTNPTIYVHSSGLAVATTTGTYTIYHDTMRTNCSPVPVSSPLLAVDFTVIAGDVFIVLISNHKIEVVNASGGCLGANTVATFTNQSISSSSTHQIYDIYDKYVGVVTINKGLYNVTYYDLTSSTAVFHQTSFERPLVFTILNVTEPLLIPTETTPTTAASPTVNITHNSTADNTTTTATPYVTIATHGTTATPHVTTATHTIPAGTNIIDAISRTGAVQWWYFVVPITIVAMLVLVISIICYICGKTKVAKLSGLVPTHGSPTETNYELANNNGRGPICNPSTDVTETSSLGTLPRLDVDGFAMADSTDATQGRHVGADEFVIGHTPPGTTCIDDTTEQTKYEYTANTITPKKDY